MRRKLQYLRREALTELGLSNPRTAEFYGALLMLIFNYWFRMYAHYVGEWIVCRMIGTCGSSTISGGGGWKKRRAGLISVLHARSRVCLCVCDRDSGVQL